MRKAVSAAVGTVTVHVPIAFRRGRGSKLIVSAGGSRVTLAADQPRNHSALVKAIARAFRWRKLLETGVYSTIQDIAGAEKVNASYMGRVLRLTLLAPEIVEAILDGSEAHAMTVEALMKPLPPEWTAQRLSSGLDCPIGQRLPVGFNIK